MSLREPMFSGKGSLLGGQWVRSSPVDGVLRVPSPADTDDLIGEFPWSLAHAAQAVEAARKALPSWRKTSLADRAALLRSYASVLSRRKEELTKAIARHIGKPLWEARTEVDAMIAKVEISLGAGLELVTPRTQSDGSEIRYRPVGVCAVLGPFNFPGHLPNGHFVPALAAGNTVVFKPSERAPLVGELVAECMLEAGFPAGVFNVVQGPGPVARALVEHASVAAVFFTGSTHVGRAILEASTKYPGRMIALEMGGKNSAIVCGDAALSHAVRELAFSAYVTAGQRCTATSRVFVQRTLFDAFLSEMTRVVRGIAVGAPHEANVLYGPVIDQAAMDRAIRVGAALERACDAASPCVRAEVSLQGNYLRPGLYGVRNPAEIPAEAKDELFAPMLLVQSYDTDEEAIALVNDTDYGLAAAVFTAEEKRFEGISEELDVGLCNWNRGTVGSSSRLPFGGVRSSGNHRPAGLFSAFYCSDPVGSLRIAQPKPGPAIPGLPE